MTEQNPDELVYMTIDEVATRYRSTGYGPRGKKVGTRVLYPMSEIERFDREIADQTAEPTAV